MALLNFEIPTTLNTLLEENYERYYIKETIPAKRLKEKLKEAKQLFKEEGAGYIIDYFDTYISAIINKSQTPDDVLIIAYQDLHRAVIELNKTLTLILSDKELLVDEIKLKYVNLIKMLIYAYVNIIITTDTRLSSEATLKNNKKSKDICTQQINKGETIQQLNTLLQQEIRLFWDPPRVEEPFITIITEICYYFLEKSSIKSDKEIVSDIFNLFGTLLTEYRYSAGFVFRMAELVKSHEHTVLFVSQGIKLLVESYNAKSLVREFVKQITEWQTDEKLQNAEATRNCANVLTEMAKLMPKFMVEEVMYLTEYLTHDSYSLRISVLNVITEILLTTLFKPDLSEEEKESRDEFLEELGDHILDISAIVRAKVIQNWSRLQKENFLTPVQQTTALRKIAPHLKDKGSNVRKCAIACITSFLEHNAFGSELKLKQMQETLDKEKEIFEKLKAEVFVPHLEKIREAETEWAKIKDEIKEVIENNIAEDDEEERSEEFNLTMQQVAEVVKMFIKDKKYREALKITKASILNIPELVTWKQTIMNQKQPQNETDIYLKLMFQLYVNVLNKLSDTLFNVPESEKEKFLKQEELVNYYQTAVDFLTEIENCIVTMKDLLESVNISEVYEAIEFFIVSYKFNIDNALQGILEMLNIMQRPEQDRKSAVIKALKKIFLETNASTMPEHLNIIVERLISFLNIIPYEKVTNFKIVIYNWVIEGKLDNNIIERLFQYFVKKEQVSDEVSLKAVQLLTLIAPGKKTIVTKNLRMISEVILEKRCANDMILLAETCKLLTAGTSEPQLVTDKNPPFKLKPTDNIWKILSDILFENFDKDVPFYNLALIKAIRFIYSLCSKPDQICEELIMKILKKLNMWNNPGEKEYEIFIIIRLCHLLGEVAICQLCFLDDIVYKEIKRRFYITTEEVNNRNNKKGKNDKVHDYSTASSSKRNMTSSTIEEGEESMLEGAQADDAEADFILNVLEHKIVTSETSLGALSSFIANICEHPNTYDDEHLQCTTVLALLKYMLVSSKFCSSYTRLIFSLLEKSAYVAVKCNIIIAVGDLLERFPNVIEPWTIHLYNRLNDPEHKVRMTAFHILANLLLRDMLLVKSHISYMAVFISEERNELSDMSKNFFSALAIRDNHLYNVLPDIFTHLVSSKDDVKEEEFRYIMKHLIGLITAVKHTESLVDRFCLKFQGTEDPYICRNIAYSLSLLQYNEKAAKNFSENFIYYKHIIHNNDVYSFVKQIINSWSKLKNDVKPIITELEEKINGVFEVRDGDDDNRNTPRPTRPVFKKPKGRAVRKNKKRVKMSGDADSDEDENDASKNISTPARKSNRKRTERISNTSANSDSD